MPTLTLKTSGLTLQFNSCQEVGTGRARTVYSDAAMKTPVTLPVQVNVDTVFYVPDSVYALNVTLSGTSFNLTPDAVTCVTAGTVVAPNLSDPAFLVTLAAPSQPGWVIDGGTL